MQILHSEAALGRLIVYWQIVTATSGVLILRCNDAGEAQKIDRIMEKFAERYCRDNQGIFSSADGPYLLAFALIMLNTDAHNPRADKKLSCEDFVTMCQAQVA